MMRLKCLALTFSLLLNFIDICLVRSFNILDYTHYFDYLPVRQEGLAGFEDFRTSLSPPSSIRNRKMEIGTLKIDVDSILANPLWPTKWPYSFEDFRPWDYTRDEPINTLPQYQYLQSLLVSDQISIVPGLLNLPIRRHFILPKDKVALSEHMDQYFFEGAKVLELFSCYESILPPSYKLGSTVGIGWMNEEMLCNPDLDDFIQQDITVDPFLPLADSYFDFVIVPCMFQLFQRPLDMFQEINRVLKPGGTAFIGVKLAMWSFLAWKQGRYYAETNYYEDILAAGSFFHYAGGYTKPQSFDLNLPEVNIVGKVKDVLFPQPRLDFYALVQAKKTKDSPHGRVKKDFEEDTSPPPPQEQIIEGKEFQPKVLTTPFTKEKNLGPYY